MTQSKKRRNMVTTILLLSVLAPLVVMAFYVDDWSRDLTTNTAATSPEATDERLRPLDCGAPSDAVKTAAEAFAQANAAWTLVQDNPEPLPADSPVLAQLGGARAATLHLVRKTGLMGYRDDIWLVLEATEAGGTRVHADSRSRLGKGDLGQNPRNLRELLAALEAAISG